MAGWLQAIKLLSIKNETQVNSTEPSALSFVFDRRVVHPIIIAMIYFLSHTHTIHPSLVWRVSEYRKLKLQQNIGS
jgi:hypothetical protein